MRKIDEATLAAVAGWLRVIGAEYGPQRARKFEAAARFVECHNAQMELKAARAQRSKPPQRPRAAEHVPMDRHETRREAGQISQK